MDNKSNGSSSTASIETPASKQNSSTPNDVSSACVESKSITDTTELLLQKEPAHTSTAPSISKKVGNRNAVRHGLYSKYVPLPWESESDFQQLLEEFRDEWKPSGRSEEEAVFDLAYLTLLKWRALASEQLHFFRSTNSAELKSGECSWDDIIRHETKVPAHALGALSTVKTLVNDLEATHEKIRSLPYWTENSEGKEVQHNIMLLKRDVSTLKEQINKNVIDGVQTLVEIVNDSSNRFDEAYQADQIEKQLDRAGKFDSRMEKVVRRLIQIKIFKRVDGVEVANPPQ